MWKKTLRYISQFRTLLLPLLLFVTLLLQLVTVFHNQNCSSEHTRRFPKSANLLGNTTKIAPPENASRMVVNGCLLN
jgi:hypothetical protein